ncbi:MAG: hypothetical protein H7645_07160 [Candidatus Heimdallarchaeota archaeon]|nr:hypothetical protein [Candidatus Heimdallarchaeota archaeon]MCK4770102.1 hypothetical protein [Candidatus Heimdallarchaeota archaeon]
MNNSIQHLLSLLEKAAAEMLSYGEEPTFSYFDTCEDVGMFIQNIVNKIKNGEVEEISKLWYIFAPTSVWDDSGGSQEIANEIFKILNTKYRPDKED